MTAVTLSSTEQAALDDLASTLTDLLGRGVSKSAAIRALVRFAGQQRDVWLAEHVLPQIEQELPAHHWGLRPGR
jgi:hypothetical protein